MNKNERSESIQDLIDLLSENELDLAERSALLETLDHEQDGWKHCALTLLETAALRSSLQFSRQTRDSEASRPGITPKSSYSIVLKLAAAVVAASLLVWLGFGIGRTVHSPGDMGLIATNATKSDAANDAVNQVMNEAEDLRLRTLHNQLAANDPDLMRQFKVDLESIGNSDTRVVAFLSTMENNRPRVFPIVTSDILEQQLANTPEPRLPNAIVQELKNSGWRVETQRQLLSVAMSNEKRSTFPIETLNYTFVGRPTF